MWWLVMVILLWILCSNLKWRRRRRQSMFAGNIFFFKWSFTDFGSSSWVWGGERGVYFWFVFTFALISLTKYTLSYLICLCSLSLIKGQINTQMINYYLIREILKMNVIHIESVIFVGIILWQAKKRAQFKKFSQFLAKCNLENPCGFE